MVEDQGNLRLLGRLGSINVRKAMWTAREAGMWTAREAGIGLVHETEWGAERDLRSPEFRALNPNCQVPVLVSGDLVLWESNTICRYLAARAGRTDLLPTEPGARAEVEKWMDWQATDLNGAWRTAFMALVRQSPDYCGDSAAIARSIAQWNALMLLLEARIDETRAYAAGESFTLADIVLGLSLQRWLLTPISRPPTPQLDAYRERLLARPAVRDLDPATP